MFKCNNIHELNLLKNHWTLLTIWIYMFPICTSKYKCVGICSVYINVLNSLSIHVWIINNNIKLYWRKKGVEKKSKTKLCFYCKVSDIYKHE